MAPGYHPLQIVGIQGILELRQVVGIKTGHETRF